MNDKINTLAEAMVTASEIIDAHGLQFPDTINFHKQNISASKWWIKMKWTVLNGEATYNIEVDWTPHYFRIIGDIEGAPKYTPGTHNYPVIEA